MGNVSAGGEMLLKDIIIAAGKKGLKGSLIVKVTCDQIDGSMDAFKDILVNENLVAKLFE